MELEENVYFTQLITQEFKEFKELFSHIQNILRENLDESKLFFVEKWFFINRYNERHLITKKD
jgi:hypothetical protein